MSLEDKIEKSPFDWYFRPKSIERWKNGRIYEWLGVRLFRDFLDAIYWHSDDAGTLAKGIRDRDQIEKFKHWTCVNESIHIMCASLTAPSVVNSYNDGDYKHLIFLAVANIAVNLYPIFLQRYNRVRVSAISDRLEQ